MSQFETDRENEAVGPEVCLDCLHPLRLHGPDGCEFERGDSDETGCALGPCGCSATTIESVDQELLFCQHAGEKKINLSTAMVECSACDEPIFDLNPQLSPVLRVERA